ncbi:MAG TPA: hypothetical protein VLT16_04110 [Candidatus Limnocylindrales bacterium]|nr:hypothetical protein [Candidatus Limnocylindrales bacterium]
MIVSVSKGLSLSCTTDFNRVRAYDDGLVQINCVACRSLREFLLFGNKQGHAAAFFLAAQRFLIPSLIRLRTSGESRRPPFLPFPPILDVPALRLPCKAAMALSKRSLSASNSAISDCVSMGASPFWGLCILAGYRANSFAFCAILGGNERALQS